MPQHTQAPSTCDFSFIHSKRLAIFHRGFRSKLQCQTGRYGVASKRYGEPGEAILQIEGELDRDPARSKVNVATKKICFLSKKIGIFKFEAHFLHWMTIIGAELTFSCTLPGYRTTRADIRSNKMFFPSLSCHNSLVYEFYQKTSRQVSESSALEILLRVVS